MSLSELLELLMDREAWLLRFMGSQRVRHDWATELNVSFPGYSLHTSHALLPAPQVHLFCFQESRLYRINLCQRQQISNLNSIWLRFVSRHWYHARGWRSCELQSFFHTLLATVPSASCPRTSGLYRLEMLFSRGRMFSTVSKTLVKVWAWSLLGPFRILWEEARGRTGGRHVGSLRGAWLLSRRDCLHRTFFCLRAQLWL